MRTARRDDAGSVETVEVEAALVTVARSRVAQGLPPTVRDTRVLMAVGELLTRTRRAGRAARSRTVVSPVSKSA